MRMCFEGRTALGGQLLRFYDDFTWIAPTPDGGIAEGGDWEIVDDELHFKLPPGVRPSRRTEYGRAIDELQVPFREWRQRLELQVAAMIVGTDSSGSNY